MDPCCFLCRSAHGVCLTRGQCEHHKAAQAQDEVDSRARQTYRNPTEDQAIRNVMRSRKPKRRAAGKRPFTYPKEN
ncbi:hypothetical protein SEA_BAUER_69 [Arthrobacter phage Bauer]|uniref:Uncharacterized protein n=1 Tax=Arthrobacter phage Bauer TaxID=2985648 RepID=A0A9E7V2M6_9CAUD|nr:hypothetical protein QEO99_gp69 [Arthrobacter phage Bauer]UYM26618.1 hypothetical protein SEA_BAUER_69 [Arthrobacter phage Bauer]